MAEAEEEADSVDDHHGELGEVEGRRDLSQRLDGVSRGQETEEEAGAGETDQVQAALQHLQHLAQPRLVGGAAELGDQHQDEESYPGVVHRLLGGVDLGEEFHNENSGGDRAEQSSGDCLRLGEEGEESRDAVQLEDVGQMTVDVDQSAGSGHHGAQQEDDQEDGGVQDEVEPEADEDDEDGEGEGEDENDDGCDISQHGSLTELAEPESGGRGSSQFG